MKSINFTEKELEFIRQQYQVELEEAETYVENIKNILNKIGVPSTAAMKEPIEQEPKVIKRRGRQPKAKDVEPKVPKKRGRKPKAVIAEPKVPKKRGRPFKVAPVPTSEPKKRGRKPRVSAEPTSQPKPVPTAEPKVEKKIVKKKSPIRRRRSNWGGVRLTPMSKPIRLKEPKEEPEEETEPVIEPIVVPTEEPIVISTQETIITPTEETKE